MNSVDVTSDGSKLTGTLYGKRPIPLEGTIDGNALNHPRGNDSEEC
jgi:hypothetical protein